MIFNTSKGSWGHNEEIEDIKASLLLGYENE